MNEIDVDKVCFLVVKARELGAKVEIDDPDSGSNPRDDKMIDVLEEPAEDATYDEAHDFIAALNVDEQVALVALTWLGRGDFTLGEWKDALVQARDAHNERTAEYLLGMPLLADFLEEGLAAHGDSCAETERAHL